jgi:hypothetical protein
VWNYTAPGLQIWNSSYWAKLVSFCFLINSRYRLVMKKWNKWVESFTNYLNGWNTCRFSCLLSFHKDNIRGIEHSSFYKMHENSEILQIYLLLSYFIFDTCNVKKYVKVIFHWKHLAVMWLNYQHYLFVYYSPPKGGGGYRNSLCPSVHPLVLPSDIFVRSISQKVNAVSTWNFIGG